MVLAAQSQRALSPVINGMLVWSVLLAGGTFP